MDLNPLICSVSDLQLKYNLVAYQRMSAVNKSVEDDMAAEEYDEEQKGIIQTNSSNHVDLLA